MSNFEEKENPSAMEKPMSTSGMQPPPYSAYVSSQEYTLGSSVVPTAPYPVTPDSEQIPHPMLAPPPYYHHPMTSETSEENGIPMSQSSHNPTYAPAIYDPVVTATPTSQQNTHGGNAKRLVAKICLTVMIVVIMIIMGIAVNYFIEEVF